MPAFCMRERDFVCVLGKETAMGTAKRSPN